MHKSISERELTRQFLMSINENYNESVCYQCGQCPCRCIETCGYCSCNPCQCDSHVDRGYHEQLKSNEKGEVSQEELYKHFDLNNDGIVTTREYADHIDYHCKYPETLDHYRDLRNKTYPDLKCHDSYDLCSKHLLSNPDDIDIYLKPLMDKTGATCIESSAKSLLDILQTLINCKILN